MREKHPELGQVDVTRRLAQKWKEIGPERRVSMLLILCTCAGILLKNKFNWEGGKSKNLKYI